MTIATLESLRLAVSRKRTEDLHLSFDGAVTAVAADLHLTVDDVLRAFGPPRDTILMQDLNRGLTDWLADKPDARRHAREAAQALVVR